MIINLKDGRFVRIDTQKNEKGVYSFYSEGILLGVYDPKVMKSEKFLKLDFERNHTLKDEVDTQIRDELNSIVDQIKEQINTMDDTAIEEETEKNRALGEYLREIGENPEKTNIIAEVDIEEKEDKEEKREEHELPKQEDSNDIENNVIEASKINIKSEINLGEAASNVQNVRRMIETKSGMSLPSGSLKIAVIGSGDLRQIKDDKGSTIDKSTTQYGLAIIRRDENGKVIAEPLKKYIPQLEQNRSSGTNPTKAVNQIQTNGDVENDPVISEYRIGNLIIDMDKDSMDNMEVHFGEYGPSTNNITRTEIRNNRTVYKQNAEERGAALNYYGGIHKSENPEKELEKCGEEHKKDYRDADGNPTTKSDEHISEMARRILDSSDVISNNYNQQDVERHLREAIEKNHDLTEKEITEKVTDGMEATAELEHEQRTTENH